MYLENELVGLAQFGRVLVKLLVLFDLVVVGSVEQQLLDVSGLQPVGGHVHQDLTQLGGGELQMGDEDGCREEEKGSGGRCGGFTSVFSHYKEDYCSQLQTKPFIPF